MTDRIAISAPERIREGSALTATVRFLAASAATTPTNARYRVDDPDGCEKFGWTQIDPADTASITIPASVNECTSCLPVERRELIVMADAGLTGQLVERVFYEIENVRRIP